MDRSAQLKASDALLKPGRGHTPSYGIDDSRSYENPDSPDRWSVVALCAFTACLASTIAGMSLSFSSIIINELDKKNDEATNVNENWKIDSDGIEASLIGVNIVVMPLLDILSRNDSWLHALSDTTILLMYSCKLSMHCC